MSGMMDGKLCGEWGAGCFETGKSSLHVVSAAIVGRASVWHWRGIVPQKSSLHFEHASSKCRLL